MKPRYLSILLRVDTKVPRIISWNNDDDRSMAVLSAEHDGPEWFDLPTRARMLGVVYDRELDRLHYYEDPHHARWPPLREEEIAAAETDPA